MKIKRHQNLLSAFNCMRSSRGLLPFFKLKAELKNDQRSAYVGEFKALLKLKPENRNKNQFHRACKRVYVNPYNIVN